MLAAIKCVLRNSHIWQANKLESCDLQYIALGPLYFYFKQCGHKKWEELWRCYGNEQNKSYDWIFYEKKIFQSPLIQIVLNKNVTFNLTLYSRQWQFPTAKTGGKLCNRVSHSYIIRSYYEKRPNCAIYIYNHYPSCAICISVTWKIFIMRRQRRN